METAATTAPLSLANIEKAGKLIDPVFRNSPQFEDDTLNAAVGRRVLVKVETANPVRSFKGRGADFFTRSLAGKQRIVCASAGNFGQAMAYAGRSRNIPVEVFAANDVNPAKAERMRLLGAKVTLAGIDFEAAKQNARLCAAQHADCIFVEDGAEDAIAEGAGTIAVELLAAGAIDTVVVPVGDGALITGIATWFKDRSPRTQIVGVCAQGASAMFQAWRQRRGLAGASPFRLGEASAAIESTHTIADGIAVRVPIPKSVDRISKLVDDILLVDDESLIEAMRLAAAALGLLLEPAGAAGLAAIRFHKIPGDRLTAILTGSSIHPHMLPRILGSV